MLLRGGEAGELFDLPAVREWGGGFSLTLEETEAWMNVYAERPRHEIAVGPATGALR